MSSPFDRDRAVWIDQVRADRTLPPNAVKVALAIRDHINRRTQTAFVGQERLASIVGVSDRSIRTLVAQLRAAGHLEVETRRGWNRPNLYRMILRPAQADLFAGPHFDPAPAAAPAQPEPVAATPPPEPCPPQITEAEQPAENRKPPTENRKLAGGEPEVSFQSSGSQLPPNPSDEPSESGGGDARARDPADQKLRREAAALATEVMTILGIDQEFITPGWCGAPLWFEAVLRSGWRSDIVRVAAERVAAQQRIAGRPPPRTFQYLTEPIAREHAQAAAATPTASIHPFPISRYDSNAQTDHRLHTRTSGRNRNGFARVLADRAAAAAAQDIDHATTNRLRVRR